MENPNTLPELLENLERLSDSIAKGIYREMKELPKKLESLNDRHQVLKYFEFFQMIEREALKGKMIIKGKFDSIPIYEDEFPEAGPGSITIDAKLNDENQSDDPFFSNIPF